MKEKTKSRLFDHMLIANGLIMLTLLYTLQAAGCEPVTCNQTNTYPGGEKILSDSEYMTIKCAGCPTAPAAEPCPDPRTICPPPTQCPKTPECPQCPEPQPCPPKNCQTEIQEYKAAVLEKINNQRPTVENAAYDAGFYDFRCISQIALGANCSKFKEGGSRINWDLFYSPGETKEKNEGQYTFNYDPLTYCFNITQYPDENGRPRWNWDAEQCKGSTLTICHL